PPTSNGNGNGSGNGMSGGNNGPSMPPPMGPNAPGVSPLRRLTVREYNNTLRDLLGLTPGNEDLDVDQDAGGFAIGGPVNPPRGPATTSVGAGRLLGGAEQPATTAAAKIATLVPCTPVPADATAQGECAKKLISQFGRRAFRRPLGADEVADLFAVYTAHRGA